MAKGLTALFMFLLCLHNDNVFSFLKDTTNNCHFNWLQLGHTYLLILALKSRTAAISLDANLCGDKNVAASGVIT